MKPYRISQAQLAENLRVTRQAIAAYEQAKAAHPHRTPAEQLAAIEAWLATGAEWLRRAP